ncbi:hypothetical protein GCM10022286_27450 [Gryllotalpicola daejeonensis]|uniref:Uncharacterized protein n=1 Tax=Gryllotalpicola daejeonensis TaxID=993087 RepID=A0ABP7ZMS5_9MICO
MTATPTSMAQLIAALTGALPTKFRPCIPTPSDKLIHISQGYSEGEPVPAPGESTHALCGPQMTVDGAVIVPNFVICATCWADFLAQRSSLLKSATTAL